MNKLTAGVILTVLAIFGLAACGGASSDGDFFNKAAEGGMAEVELSKVAQTRAQNPEVKQFADQMVIDHTKAGDELKALAGKKNAALPADLAPDHKNALVKLQGAKDADFDKAYVDAMVKDHGTAVSLFQSQANGNGDADVKAFAAKTLPTLESHKKMITDIQGRLK